MALSLFPRTARGDGPPGRLRIGTAGWSYADWYGSFYPGPPKPPGFDELTFYAKHFACVEVNATYYRIPSPRTVEGWAARTPPDFVFAVKAYGALTHDLAQASEATFQEFLHALTPLHAAGKLGCVLLQFPPAFQPAPASLSYLAALPGLLDGLSLVLEFRHRSWVAPARIDATIELLRTHGLGFANVDEPALAGNMPRTAIRTSPIGYVRLHGRNLRDWWPRSTKRAAEERRTEIRRSTPDPVQRRALERALDLALERQKGQRYNYLYAQVELDEWRDAIETVRAEAATTFVVTNNHFVGQAVANAKMAQAMFGEPVRGDALTPIEALIRRAQTETRGGPQPVEPHQAPSEPSPAGERGG